MPIAKTGRHSKIIGEFGEMLVCNFLSRSGFEVARVDAVGMDVLAYDRESGRRIGITVKSRTRSLGTEDSSVNVLSYRKGMSDRVKLVAACEAFAAKPWIAIYVETTDTADLYLTSLRNYDAKYRSTQKKTVDDWRMSREYRQMYDDDAEIMHVHMPIRSSHWWQRLEGERVR